MELPPRISEAEWEVMKVVWKKSPCLANEIIKSLSTRTKWGPATVKTLLNRLISKGVLRFEKAGRSYVYSPAYTEEECRGAEADSLLRRVFDGALSPMISHFVRSPRLTEKELDSLEKILRERKNAK